MSATTLSEAESPEDVEAIIALFAEMAEWDAEQSAPFGITREAVLAAYYSDTATTLGAALASGQTRAWLARHGAEPAGVIMMTSPDADGTGWLEKLYVRDRFRGSGLASELVDHVLATARQMQAKRLRLVTASFMTGAHRIYDRAGFRRTPPREGESYIADFDLFMELDLGADPATRSG